MNIYYLIPGLLFSIISMIIVAVNYKFLIKFMGGKISFLNSFLIIHLLAFTNYIIPFKANQIAIKPILTKKYTEFSLSKSFLLTFIEQFFLHIYLIILVPLSLLILGNMFFFKNLNIKIIFILLFVVFLIFVLLKYKHLVKFILKFKFIFPKKLRKKLSYEFFEEKLDLIKSYLCNKKIILLFLITSIISVIIQPALLHYAVKIFTSEITYKTSLIIYWISFMAGLFSGLPAGFGTRDATMALLLKLYGYANFNILQIIIFHRLISGLPHIVIGGFSFICLGGKEILNKIKTNRTNS